MLETGVFKRNSNPAIGVNFIQDTTPFRQTEQSESKPDENAGRQSGDFIGGDGGLLGSQPATSKRVRIIAGTMGVERVEHN